ncbi:MAG: CPBP family intramembrane metalloprotease [Lachnospiraceae bacterium]|nr:CPBP family intramembrane metalloprotease [Lachnospiraceae bacterium]
MKEIRKVFKWISPFNNMEEMPTAVYIVKKMLAFLVLYFVSGILGEAVIIAGLVAAGYDPLHGGMPSGEIATLIQYFGFIIYLLMAIVYWKGIEKSSIQSLGFDKKIADYVLGVLAAVVLLGAIIGVTLLVGDISFTAVNKNINWGYTIALLLGFMIQGAAEEALCRGFLQTTLMKKVPAYAAILLSALAFAFPHFSTLFEAETKYAMTGIVNLALISIIFSVLRLYRANIWATCGLHSIWNFLLYGVFGLTLSGSESGTTGILCFEVDKCSMINGGAYGLEASILTTVILAIAAMALILRWKKAK